MFNLQLSRSRKARIWINDLPEGVLLEPSDQVERRFLSSTTMLKSCQVAIELFIPRGARFDYGLIGGELIANESNEFVTTICHSTEARLLSDSLAGPLDEVKVGLPLDYAVAVLEGIAAVAADRNLPGGELKVRWAAYGASGSSVFFFRLLGKILFKIMTGALGLPDEKEMTGYFEKLIASTQQ